MTDPILFWLSIGLCVIAIALLAAAAATRRSPGTQPAITPCAGPIGKLSFAESLDPAHFAEAADESALEQVTRHFGARWADGTVITLQTLQQWAARSQMAVAASSEASKRLGIGAANLQRHRPSGRLLPHVVDARTGRSWEVMKRVRFGSRALAGAAAASAIVVSAAHMVSAAELARTLNKVDQKLDLLLAYRRVDQDATLERIYTAARELLAVPLSETQRMELWRLRGELRQLRATWRREWEHHLREIDDLKDKGWFDRMTTVRSWYNDRVSRKISEGELQVLMVEYSLRLDWILADASGTWDAAQVTLTDELDAIERVGALLKEKASFISDARRASAQQMVERIEATITGYRTLIRFHAAPPATAERTTATTAQLLEG